MAKFRFREKKSHKKKIFAPTADKTNLRNVRVHQPRGGRCL